MGEHTEVLRACARMPVGGEFPIRLVSRSFCLDPILPLHKYERDQLRGAEVTTL
jgi:hypothetical protein